MAFENMTEDQERGYGLEIQIQEPSVDGYLNDETEGGHLGNEWRGRICPRTKLWGIPKE